MSNSTAGGNEDVARAALAGAGDGDVDAKFKAMAAQIIAKALAELPKPNSADDAGASQASVATDGGAASCAINPNADTVTSPSRCATDAVHPRFIDMNIETPTGTSSASGASHPKEKKALKVAIVQMKTGCDKMVNISNAVENICKAASEGAQMVVLPECFNSPYGNHYFRSYAESFDCSPTLHCIRCAAVQNQVCVVAGSIPECCGGNIYNTCTVWDYRGELIAVHRKMHLFDICIPGEICFMESQTMSAGSRVTYFDYGSIRVGVGICYDIRFYELAHIMAHCGCDLLVYPAAFNMVTGPKHWELLARARANDLQCYVVLASPARDESADYIAWGHSLAVNPWGQVMKVLDHKPGMFIVDIDPKLVAEVRARIPIREQRRTDLYDTITKTPPPNAP